MDPALHELLDEGSPDEVIEAVIRLDPGGEPPPGVELVARFGDIATCRLRRADIVRVRDATDVDSLKAPRFLAAEPTVAADDSDPAPCPSDVRRPAGLDATGRGAVVAALDWGCDFAHPAFRTAEGRTRLVALWDQRGPRTATSPQPYGYGRLFTREDIDRALAAADPYAALGYHPGDGDPDGSGSHGTHVLSIAAGSAAGDGPAGVAPEADLAFVHLTTRRTGGLANLGDSVTILEALDFLHRTAGDRPLVVNASVGRHGGPHDGSTLVEQGLDWLVASHPGRAVVQSTGNYFDADVHAAGRLQPGETHTLRWAVDPADVTPNELEVWYPARDRFDVELVHPETGVVRLPPGQATAVTRRGAEVGRVYHRVHDPNNGRHHVDVFLDAGGPGGVWEVRLVGTDVADGRYHAWVERDAACPGCQSRFHPDTVERAGTTGTIANGFRTIAVGAYDGHDPDRTPARFSSVGPTLDGRQKPECAAPGVRVLGARSAPPGATEPRAAYTRKSGTSMAAPHVAGAVACMYEAAGRPLTIQEVRAALTAGAVDPPSHVDPTRVGAGCLDVAAAVDAVRSRGGEMGACRCNQPEAAEQVVEACRPGEGPPGPEPDPTGRSLHPTVGRGTTPARSRRPSVGYAQQCLNNWLAGYRAGSSTCPPATTASIDAAIAELGRTGQLPLAVDCRFGPATQRATRAFQACMGIDRDGVIGRVTWPLLVRFAPTTTPPVTTTLPTPPSTPPTTLPTPPDDDVAVRRWRQVLGPGTRDGNEVVDLVDGPETFRAMAAAIRTATGPGHYVYLLAWWLDIDEPLDVPAGNPCAPTRHSDPSTLRNLLQRASDAGVQVRAIAWDRTLSTKNDAEVRFIDRLRNGGAFTDNHQLDSTIGSQHQKLLVVYGTEGLLAFCGGVDVNCDRICATCPPGGSGGSSGAGGAGSPQHDVHCRIKGPAAHDLLGVFVKRWFSNPAHRPRDRRAPLLGLSTPLPPPAGRAVVRVGETYNADATMPGGGRRRFRDRSVQDILLRVIAGARRYIYIEDQYLIGLCAAEALRRALAHVDHVTVLIAPSQISDARRPWEFRKDFVDHVRRGPHQHKFHVFVRCGRAPGRPPDFTAPHAYVHAKTLIADDEVAVIGSANVNRRGWEHDAEVVAAVAGPGRDGAPLARTLRTRLWVEHLGVTPAAVADPVASQGLWRTAPARQVCVYDPVAGTDPLLNRLISRDTIDPGAPLAGAPCCAIHGPSCPGGGSVPAPQPLVAQQRQLARTP